MSEPIKCIGVVYKVQSLAGNGIRVSIDLPDSAVMQAAMFMECQRMQVVLDVQCTPQDTTSQPDGTTNDKKGRHETKSLRSG
jgi:hypothetical protein